MKLCFYKDITIEELEKLKSFDFVCDGDNKTIIAYPKERK